MRREDTEYRGGYQTGGEGGRGQAAISSQFDAVTFPVDSHRELYVIPNNLPLGPASVLRAARCSHGNGNRRCQRREECMRVTGGLCLSDAFSFCAVVL